jgi:hypothetical protein
MGRKTGREDDDGPQNALEIFAEELKAQREAAGLTPGATRQADEVQPVADRPKSIY